MGDALGVLHDARKFRPKDPILNKVMAEMAVLIAPLGLELRAIHLWTQRNKTCDALSRLKQNGELPGCLRGVHRCSRSDREFSLLRKEKS